MRFEFIDLHRSEFRVKKMCHVLEVSRSAYYAWKRRGKSKRQQENEALLDRIVKIYEFSRRIYGSPRITEELLAQGVCVGENRIARLMRENNIRSRIKRRFKITTTSGHQLPIFPNLLDQRFEAEGPNQIWASDISYVWTSEGWLYLAVILDVFSRVIVGWSTSRYLDRQLVLNALKRALFYRQVSPGLIFHSDRGSQYASEDVKELIRLNGFVQSMSRKGNPYDNAIVETFFHSLKTEWVYFERYRTREQATQSIFEYIEPFYNRTRLHSSLGYLAPMKYELNYAKVA
ncbi:transposase [bacterium I07]|nr:transposase [bacterium I07]